MHGFALVITISLSLPICSTAVRCSASPAATTVFGLVDHYLQTVVRTQPVVNDRIEMHLLP